MDEALEKINANHNQYSFYIVDRQLNGTNDENVRKIWNSFNRNNSNLMDGDYLLKYLSRELGLKNSECLEKFRFLTHNASETETLIDFLKKDNEMKETDVEQIIIPKDDEYKYIRLKKEIENNPFLRIKKDYESVFKGLKILNRKEFEAVLIEALLYVENKEKMDKIKFKEKLNSLRNIAEEMEFFLEKDLKKEKGLFKLYINNFLGEGKNDLTESIIKETFTKKPTKKINEVIFIPQYTKGGEIENYHKKHYHYSCIYTLIWRITNQNSHNNPTLDEPNSYRLNIVVYGICELLRFYYNVFGENTIV